MTKQEVITKALKKAGLEYDYTSKNSVKIWYKRVIEDGLEFYAKEYTFTELVFSHDFARALWGEEHDCGAGYHKKREIMHIPERKLSDGSIIPAKDEEINLDYVAYCLHGTQKNWQYHLQQMVIAEDPIKYLGENI